MLYLIYQGETAHPDTMFNNYAVVRKANNMAKIVTITKKTHAYLLDDGAIVRAISEAHVEEYQKEKKTVYSCAATKTVDGKKVETVNYYVNINDFVKRSSSRQSLASKLASVTDGVDLTKMSAAELVALLG